MRTLTMRCVAAIGAVFLLFSKFSLATEFQGTVLKVLDGDSLLVLLDKKEVVVRLAEIDAPEYGQPYGDEAKQALYDLVGGKTIRFVVQATDEYGRFVARVYLDAMDINASLVQRGTVWVYRRYLKEQKLLDYEQQARNARRGLWALSTGERVPPWKWRAARRALEQSRAPLGTSQAVIANRRSRIYHLPGCPGYDEVAPQNQVSFSSATAAEAAGFRRARNCSEVP